MVLLYVCVGLLACHTLGSPRGFYWVAGLVYCTLPEFVHPLPFCCSDLAWASGFHEVVAAFAWFVVAFLFTCACVARVVCLSSVINHCELTGIVSLLVLLVGLFLHWSKFGVCCSGLIIGVLRIFTLGYFRPELCFVCHTRFFMWVLYKDWML